MRAQHPFDQSTYQVRLEWGAAGLERLAPCEIVVVVDVLGFSTATVVALERGERPADAATGPVAGDAAAAVQAAADRGALVLVGALRNASAVAAAVYGEQGRRGARTSVAVIAVGDGGRFAVEDQLGAGAVVDALGALGIDHTSPDAAVACEGFRALRRASKHLLTASGSGARLVAAGQLAEVHDAAAVDAASVVPVLRGGVFEAL